MTPGANAGPSDDWSYALVVLAKEPIPGRVKTRLCPPYSLDEAAQLAGAALDDTLDAVLAAPAARRFLVLDGDPAAYRRPGLEVLFQHGDGLDERLGNALVDVAARTGLPVLLIGMDTPQVTPALLRGAAETLRDVGAVLGPATDGGFWTLGLHSPRREHCAGVPMSRPDTGQCQLERLQELGVHTTLVNPLTDVDDAATARAVARSAPTTRFARTLATLDAVASRPVMAAP